jgi:hypothetical protein
MKDVGVVNIFCENELILAQVVNREQNLYRSLNVTMGAINPFDVIKAKQNEGGILEFISVVEEGIPHKKIFSFADDESWRKICIAATKYAGKCILQGLARPKGTQHGIFVVAYEEGFDPDEVFSGLVEAIPEE